MIILAQIVVCIVKLGVLENFSRILQELELLEVVGRSTQLPPLGSRIYQRLLRTTSLRSLPALSRLLFHSTSSHNLSTLTSQHRTRRSLPHSLPLIVASSIISDIYQSLFSSWQETPSVVACCMILIFWRPSVLHCCCRPHERRVHLVHQHCCFLPTSTYP